MGVLPDRATVDALMARALATGGTEPRAAQDLPFMSALACAHPDGHIREPFRVDAAVLEPSGP